MDNFEKIYQNEALNGTINELLKRFVLNRFLGQNTPEEVEYLSKAGWLSSILAESTRAEHKEKAQLFAILVHLNNSLSNEKYDKLSYVILSRMGNLLSTKFLSTLFASEVASISSFKYQFGEALNIELLQDRKKRIITIDEREILTTDFQLDLWKKLSSGSNLSISAPTSAGKSYIIQNHFLELFKRKEKIQGLYIVPTKALINQASEDLLEILPNVEVKTSFIEEERIYIAEGDGLHPSQYYTKLMYVLTPERCLKLLQNAIKVGFYPQIIFIDEIQNVEDLNGRGVLFEYVLESISNLFSKSKIITAGPFIKNEKKIFQEVLKLENVSCKTNLAPVMQLKTIVRNSTSENELELSIFEKSLSQSIQIKVPVQFNLNRELGNNKGVGFAKVVLSLSKEGQKNIVYCPQTDYVEIWALKLEKAIYQDKHLSLSLRELIDFLSEEIHPKYLLIKCLKKGIAFHHSILPDIVRKEIEDLFKEGELDTLYCTSTLLQGVNLPAHNLFITKPRKRNVLLSPFEFGNLIGRAGRIRDSLYGIIYCIEGKNERWAEEFYKFSYEKNITTATRKSLQDSDSLLTNIEKTSKEIKEDSVSYALTILRQKYLAEPEQFLSYLASKDVEPNIAGSMLNGIANSLVKLNINSKIASLNPTIDPLLQDALLNKIKEEGKENWIIKPNPNFFKKIGRDYVDSYSYQDLNFYWQFAILCEKLDSILKIREEAYFKQGVSLSIRQIAYYGFRWLQNKSLKEIIIDDINYHGHKLKSINPENDDDINNSIKNIINIHSKVVTYLLVKYFKLLVDLQESIMDENEREKYKFTLSLPIMLELGTTEPIVIQLISAGITRSVALRLFREFKKYPNNKDIDIFEWMKVKRNLRGVDNIYIRYLKKLKFIS